MRASWLLSTVVVAVVGCAEPNRLPAQAANGASIERANEPAKVAPSAAARPVPAVSEALSPAQIAAQANQSVVVAITPEGRGAGFVVGPNLVATCFHVVAGTDRIAVRTPDGVEHAAHSVVAYDQADDIALLSVDALGSPQLRFGDFTAITPGDPVTVIGHPRGLDSSVSTGIVSAVRTVDAQHQLLQITAPISPGSSGGPVLNQKGEVIGVTSFLLQNGQELNFAVPVPALAALRESKSPPISLAEFAATTVATSEPQVAPGAASARQYASTPASFPAKVAGFTFGMTLAQAQATCATPDSQAPANHGDRTHSRLAVDGVHAECPFAPEPLEFVEKVSLKFAANRLVRITLVPSSEETARERLFAKYGQPRECGSHGEARRSPEAERRAASCAWVLQGGELRFGREGAKAPARVEYISSTENELGKLGY